VSIKTGATKKKKNKKNNYEIILDILFLRHTQPSTPLPSPSACSSSSSSGIFIFFSLCQTLTTRKLSFHIEGFFGTLWFSS
jgi:hypothetical protein